MPRHDDDLGVGLRLQDRAQQAKSLARSVGVGRQTKVERHHRRLLGAQQFHRRVMVAGDQHRIIVIRSEEHTSELQSLMRISYAVFCLKKTSKSSKMS